MYYNHTNCKLHWSGCNLCLNFGHVHVCMVFENRLGYVRMVPSIWLQPVFCEWEPLSAQSLLGVFKWLSTTMSREQWITFLEWAASQKICLSCWAGQLEKYLSRRGILSPLLHSWYCQHQKKSAYTKIYGGQFAFPLPREDYIQLLLVSRDCRCEMSDDEAEGQ